MPLWRLTNDGALASGDDAGRHRAVVFGSVRPFLGKEMDQAVLACWD